MILDGLLTFTGTINGATGAPAVAGTATDLPSVASSTQVASNIIDLGVALGIPNSAGGGGARDLGIGDYPSMKLSAIVTTAMVGGTSLQIELDGAPDNGSGAPGSYTQMWLSEVFPIATMIAGCQLANIDLPRPIFEQVLPRYLRLQYTTVGTFSGGAIEAQIVIDRDDQIIGTTGLRSGYPAGVTVAN